jgi:hypothetical protein
MSSPTRASEVFLLEVQVRCWLEWLASYETSIYLLDEEAQERVPEMVSALRVQ